MSTEHEPYYQSDAFLGYAPIKEWEFGVHLRVHTAREPYRDPQALFPLARPRGERTYVLAKPYLLHPAFRLTVTRSRDPHPGAPVGGLPDGEPQGAPGWEIGQAQAWHYPEERALVLWECFLHAPYRSADTPLDDDAQVVLWNGFESHLLRHLAPVERIYTTWEDTYERERWQLFLEVLGYRHHSGAAFVKELPLPHQHHP